MDKRPEEFISFIRAAATLQIPPVIVGGQACNVLARHYLKDSVIESFFPLCSEDIDFLGTYSDASAIAKKIGAEITRPEGVFNILCAVVRTSDGLRADFLSALLGAAVSDVNRNCVMAEVDGVAVRLLHPLILYESKAANLSSLDQTGRRDARHLAMMELVVSAHLHVLAAKSEARPYLACCERLLSLSTAPAGRRVVELGFSSPYKLIAHLDERSHSRIAAFHAVRLPRWLKNNMQ